MTLRDKMATLLPGMKWTRHAWMVADGAIGNLRIVRVSRWTSDSRWTTVTMLSGVWSGRCQSLAHAATTIRRKLTEFRNVFIQAAEAARSKI